MENKIKTWLNDQGYPLEFKVANEFRDNGFNVIQAEYYFDKETNVSREIDVKASVQKIVNGVLFRFSLIVECKLSKDKPWVLFTSSDSKISEKAKIVQLPASMAGSLFLRRLCEKEENWNKKIFDIGIRPAFGITQAFTTGKDIPYQAITGVAKATDSICKSNTNSRQGLICNICFPIVVTEGKLFESYHDNNLEVIEIESGVLLWRNMLTSNPHTIIKIHTFESLKKIIPFYIQEIKELLNNSDEIIQGVIDDLNQQKMSFTLWK